MSRFLLAPVVVLLAAALVGQEKRTQVIIGTHERVPLEKDVKLVAVGDESILTAEILDTRQLLVLGKKAGTTTIRVWYRDQTTARLEFTVGRDVTVIQRALTDIHPSLKAEVAPDRDAIVLRGTVPTDVERNRAIRITDKFLLAGAARKEIEVATADSSKRLVREIPNPQVIDLIEVQNPIPDQAGQILTELRKLAGEGVRARIVHGPNTDGSQDTLVLEGEVRDQVTLSRVLQLASAMYVGARDEKDDVEVLADEAGGRLGGNQGNFGQQQGGMGGRGGGGFGGGGFGGGRGGGMGQLGMLVRQGNVQRNLARASIVSAAGGRVLSFLEVRDKPSVRVAVQLFEVSRNRLFQFASDLRVLGGDFDQPPLLPSPIGAGLQQNPASVGAISDKDVQVGIANLVDGFTKNIQVSGNHIAFDALFRLLEARGISRRLSSPVLTVLSGEMAQFQVGGDVPVPQAFTPAGGAVGGVGTFNTVEFRNFGIGLGVRPLVGGKDDVTLDLSTMVSQPDQDLTTLIRNTTGANLQTTAFASRSLSTNARLDDGQALLIGGLVSRSTQESATKTPVLGEIPILGWLFRRDDESFDDTELFVMVTPAIVRQPIEGAGLWAHPDMKEVYQSCVDRVQRRVESAADDPATDEKNGQKP